jgi:hypothetical protein
MLRPFGSPKLINGNQGMDINITDENKDDDSNKHHGTEVKFGQRDRKKSALFTSANHKEMFAPLYDQTKNNGGANVNRR